MVVQGNMVKVRVCAAAAARSRHPYLHVPAPVPVRVLSCALFALCSPPRISRSHLSVRALSLTRRDLLCADLRVVRQRDRLLDADGGAGSQGGEEVAGGVRALLLRDWSDDVERTLLHLGLTLYFTLLYFTSLPSREAASHTL